MYKHWTTREDMEKAGMRFQVFNALLLRTCHATSLAYAGSLSWLLGYWAFQSWWIVSEGRHSDLVNLNQKLYHLGNLNPSSPPLRWYKRRILLCCPPRATQRDMFWGAPLDDRCVRPHLVPTHAHLSLQQTLITFRSSMNFQASACDFQVLQT